MRNIAATIQDYFLGLQHIGYVVDDLETSLAEFAQIYGVDLTSVRLEPEAGVDSPSRFAFFSVAGTEFELIEACDPDLKALIETYPSGAGGINHTAWRVRELDKVMSLLADKGIVPGHVTPAGPVTFGNKTLVYLDPKTTGGHLIELIEIAE